MVDADDAVLDGLAVRELHRKLGAGIHGGLRVGVYDRGRAVLGDVDGGGLLIGECPVLGALIRAGLAVAAWQLYGALELKKTEAISL